MSFLEYPGDPKGPIEAFFLWVLIVLMGIVGIGGLIVEGWIIYAVIVALK